MPRELPFLRRDSHKEFHAFLRRVDELEREKADLKAKGEEVEAEILEDAAMDAENEEDRKKRIAAQTPAGPGQAARLRATLDALIARHEEQAERYRDQPKGA